MTRLGRQAAGDDGGVELDHYVVALQMRRVRVALGAGRAGIEMLGDHLSLFSPQRSGREVVEQVGDRGTARLFGLRLPLHERYSSLKRRRARCSSVSTALSDTFILRAMFA